MANGVEFECQLDARDQFVALGVGVIVGRCGGRGGAAASALTPSSLAILGRDWIVFPARVVVVALLPTSGGDCAARHVKISTSPTLGLVCHPTILSFGPNISVRIFYHWVGPRSCCGDRFALVYAHATTPLWDNVPVSDLCVIDHFGNVKLILRANLSGTWCSNRHWVASLGTPRGDVLSTVSLWNLDGVEQGTARSMEGVSVPGGVKRLAFGGSDGSLVVQLESGVLVVDLEATFAENRLVYAPLPLADLDGEDTFIDNIVCWEGMDHALLYQNEGLICLSTGQRREVHHTGTTCLIGGPYAATCIHEERDCGEIEVYCVFDPTKVFYTHRTQSGREILRFGNETVLLDDGTTIKVIDAVSGLVLCNMFVSGFRVTEISQHNNNRKHLLFYTPPPCRCGSLLLFVIKCACGIHHGAILVTGDYRLPERPGWLFSGKSKMMTADFNVVKDIEFKLDARDQFVALGVGVIVGRCGGRGGVGAHPVVAGHPRPRLDRVPRQFRLSSALKDPREPSTRSSFRKNLAKGKLFHFAVHRLQVFVSIIE
ncbi:hypothetical protein Pelo_16533 [Pelomyxa schiedti]|nr:hypothetical protein Pelo_16533 [Pelomyxa schiedti]